MSLESRAMTRRELTFDGTPKLKIPHGDVIYVEETEHGWLGHYYPQPFKATVHSFAIAPEDFSIWNRADSKIQELILNPAPDTTAEEQRAKEDATRRLRTRIKVYREEADRLEAALGEMA